MHRDIAMAIESTRLSMAKRSMSTTVTRLDMLMSSFARRVRSSAVFHCRLDAEGVAAVVSSSGLMPLAQLGLTPRYRFVEHTLRARRSMLEVLDAEHDASLIASAVASPVTHAASAPVQSSSERPQALVAVFAGPRRTERPSC